MILINAFIIDFSSSPGPYDIFVRELVAMDGIDNSEILLIDALGYGLYLAASRFQNVIFLNHYIHIISHFVDNARFLKMCIYCISC